MDDIDRHLLALLRANARMSVAAIAKSLGVARGTVQNRIGKLERAGTIAGYGVRLKPQTDTHRVAAIMTIEVEGNHLEKVLRNLRGDADVHTLHTTNGRWDLIAELSAGSLEAMDQVISRIRKIDSIARTETSLLLSTHKL